jgi:serine/threonine protein phosphatase PrpC
MEHHSINDSNTFRLVSAKIFAPGRNQPINDDFSAFLEPVNPVVLQQSGCLYIVASGTGGRVQGKWSSQYIVERVLSEYYHYPEQMPGHRLQEIVTKVNGEIADLSAEGASEGSDIVLAAAVILGNRLTVAIVGGCRVFLIHDGNAQLISRDRSQFSELLRMGTISLEEAEQSVTRSGPPYDLAGSHGVTVDIFEDISLYQSDVLLLGTTGLTSNLTDDHLVSLSACITPREASRQLVEAAHETGGVDENLTGLVVMVKEPEHQPASILPIDSSDAVDNLRNQNDHLPTAQAESVQAQVQSGEPQFVVKRKPRQHISILAAAVGVMTLICLTLAAVLAVRLINSDDRVVVSPVGAVSAPTFAVDMPVPLVVEPTPKSTAMQTSTATQTSTVPVIPTITFTPIPLSSTGENLTAHTATAVFEQDGRSICVRMVGSGEGLMSIIRNFDQTYSQSDTFYYYLDCSADTKKCSGEKEKITNHQTIFAGWYIEIPEMDAASCGKGEGIWAQLVD